MFQICILLYQLTAVVTRLDFLFDIGQPFLTFHNKMFQTFLL